MSANGYNCSLGAINPSDNGSGNHRGAPSWLLAQLKEEADLKFCVQPFSSVSQMCLSLSLPQSKFAHGWRLTNCIRGFISGLPNSYGQVVATDGMMCVILQRGQDKDRAFLGHFSWFVEVDVIDRQAIIKEKKQGRAGRLSVDSLLQDFKL